MHSSPAPANVPSVMGATQRLLPPAGCAGHTGGSQRECALTPWERAWRVSVMPFFFSYQPFP